MTKTTKKSTKKVEKVEEPLVSATPSEEPKEFTLPVIDGKQAVEVIEENDTAIYYKFNDDTTEWVKK